MSNRYIGEQARCQVCGGKIVLIHHPRVISLDTALWVHSGAIRRMVATHPAVGPS
jgi:hypothetical protein